MIPWVKALFTDEGKWLGLLRAAMMGLGGAQLGGFLPEDVPQIVGIGALMAGGFLRSSSKGQPVEKP